MEYSLCYFSVFLFHYPKKPKKCDFLLCPAHLTHWLSAKGTKAEFWRQRKATKLLVQYIWSGRSAVCVRLVIGGEERAAVHPPTSYHAPLRSHSQLHTTPNFFSIQACPIRFLSNPSPIIGYACYSLTDWLTDWLTDCCLVDLIDVTLRCEDANSKLVEVVTIADVDA